MGLCQNSLEGGHVVTITDIFIWIENHLPTLIFFFGGIVVLWRLFANLERKLSLIPVTVVLGETQLSTLRDLENCRKMVLDAITKNTELIEQRHDQKDTARADSILEKLDIHNKTMTQAIAEVKSDMRTGFRQVDDNITAVHSRIDIHLDKKQ